MGVKVTGLGLVGGAAHGRVQILLVRAQLRDGELFAVQLHQCAAVDLLVAAHQSIELLLQLHGAVVHAEDGILHAGHAGGAEFFGQGIHMRDLPGNARLISTLALVTAGPLASKKSCSAFQ